MSPLGLCDAVTTDDKRDQVSNPELCILTQEVAAIPVFPGRSNQLDLASETGVRDSFKLDAVAASALQSEEPSMVQHATEADASPSPILDGHPRELEGMGVDDVPIDEQASDEPTDELLTDGADDTDIPEAHFMEPELGENDSTYSDDFHREGEEETVTVAEFADISSMPLPPRRLFQSAVAKDDDQHILGQRTDNSQPRQPLIQVPRVFTVRSASADSRSSAGASN